LQIGEEDEGGKGVDVSMASWKGRDPRRSGRDRSMETNSAGRRLWRQEMGVTEVLFEKKRVSSNVLPSAPPRPPQEKMWKELNGRRLLHGLKFHHLKFLVV
jgi:hypothetical protein